MALELDQEAQSNHVPARPRTVRNITRTSSAEDSQRGTPRPTPESLSPHWQRPTRRRHHATTHAVLKTRQNSDMKFPVM